MSGGRAGRRWRRLALAIGGVALLVAAARIALSVLPAERWVARALEEWASRPVDIDAVDAFIDGGLRLELRGLRVRDPDAPADAPALLAIDRASGHQGWQRLLAGQLVPLRWELAGPVLRIGPREQDPTPEDPPEIPELDLRVSDGRIEWHRREGPPLIVRDLSVEARRGSLIRSAEASVSGVVLVGDTVLCDLRATGEGWLDEGAIRGDVADLDLSQIAPPDLRASGRVSGSFALEASDGQLALDVELDVARLDMLPPEFETPLRPASTRVEARVERGDAGAYHVRLRRLRLDDVDLGGSIHVDPVRGHTRGRIAIATFEPGPSERLHPLALLGQAVPVWAERNARIAGGQVIGAEITWDTSLKTFGQTLGFRRASRPGEFGIALRVEGGAWRLESGEVLRDIAGSLRIGADVMEIDGLRLRDGDGEPLPRIDVRVDGMHRLAHLPDDEKHTPDGPDEEMPGLATFVGMLDTDADVGAVELRFEALELRHSWALLPVRDARGTLVSRGPEVRVRAPRAVIGGVPGRLDIAVNTDADTLRVDLTYLDEEAPPRPPTTDDWLRADLAMDAVDFGEWRIELPRLRLRAPGARLLLERIEGRLLGGTLTGTGELRLHDAATVPYALELALEGADASQLAPRVDLKSSDLAGSLEARGRLEGAMSPGVSFLDSSSTQLDVTMAKGHLGGLPAILAIARLPTLGGVRALLGRPLRFDTADGHVAIREARVELSGGRLLGPELRLLADGHLDLVGEARERDLLITLLFLRGVDRVIKTVPLLRDVILGDGEGLLAASFRVSGPVDDTNVTYVPPERLTSAASWASGVIASGARRLGQLIRVPLPGKTAQTPQEEKDVPKPPETPEPGPGPDPAAP